MVQSGLWSTGFQPDLALQGAGSGRVPSLNLFLDAANYILTAFDVFVRQHTSKQHKAIQTKMSASLI